MFSRVIEFGFKFNISITGFRFKFNVVSMQGNPATDPEGEKVQR